ncbi:hypothetical protein, partial [Phaeobacter sp. SYSU ZJ3003]|uniref:hypothetical protein n=1 Tax=Phaeobacter sp. SYSU ZJ3003 TaxID=2109330 RepID=UPI00351C1C17
MKHFLVGMAACIVVALSPLLVLASNKNLSPGTPILVVSAPWGPDAPDVIAGSGLQEISPERAPFGALTVLEDLAGNVPIDVEKRFGRRCGFHGYAA